MTEKAKRQTTRAKPAGIAYAGNLPEEEQNRLAAKLERVNQGLALSPGKAPASLAKAVAGERQDKITLKAPSAAQQEEEKPMEGLREEHAKATSKRGYVAPSRADKKCISGYFPEDVADSLRDLAALQRRPLQAILDEAMNDVLAKYDGKLKKYQAFFKDFSKP